ncbi:MAG: serine/threonine-protein kinase [Acidobacteriota bacterium]
MKALAPNTLIQNRYLIVQLIGKGGMGEVYLAVDQRLGSAVALKRTFFAEDEMLGNAFEREARILARLRHPVLPKVSDHFAENGEQYLVMEHISGDDLSKRLEAAQKPFPASWVLFWADQLLDALSYLHSHEPPIIHRDIKPQNLKLTDENHIVLLDFGLSKSSTGNTNLASGQSSGSVVGYTPHYAPMEQIRGTGTDARSDLYSLSATLYQLMTNVVPSDALSRADSLLNGMADPIRKISDITPEISPDVSAVILHGMEVSQDKRYGSAREMQKALRRAYTAMQDAMSAHTIAFNSQDAFSALPDVTPPIGTSIGNTGAVASYGSEPSTEASSGSSTFPTTGTSGGFPGSTNPGSQNLDATVNYQSAVEPELRQADVKTEVYRAGDSPLIGTGYETPQAEQSYNHNPTAPVEDFRPTENFQAGKGFSPDATVPLISLEESVRGSGDQQATPEFFTTPNVTGTTGSYGTGASAQTPDQDQSQATPTLQPAKPVIAPKKKSSSKLLIALGSLAVLFVLGLIGAGAVWYGYENYYVTQPTPTPTPAPTIEATPSPEASTQIITNTNSVDNSNSSNTNSDNSNSLTVSPTPFPTPTPEVRITEEPRPTPQTRDTQRPPRTPTQKATPVPKATKPPILH